MCAHIGVRPPSVDRAGVHNADEMLNAFKAASNTWLIYLLCRQLKNMRIVQKLLRPGTDHEQLINKYVGKRSGGVVGDPENKDDLVMSFGNGLLGAHAFYRQEQFAALRASLGVRTATHNDYHLVGV